MFFARLPQLDFCETRMLPKKMQQSATLPGSGAPPPHSTDPLNSVALTCAVLPRSARRGRRWLSRR